MFHVVWPMRKGFPPGSKKPFQRIILGITILINSNFQIRLTKKKSCIKIQETKENLD